MRLGRRNLLLGAALAVALAATLTVLWVGSGDGGIQAAGAAPNMTLDASGTGVTCSGASPNRKCTVNPAGQFTVTVRAFSGGTDIGGIATEVAFQAGLTYTPKACLEEAVIAPEGYCLGPSVTTPPFGTVVVHGQGTSGLVDIPRPAATSINPAVSMPNVTCANGTFQIVLTVASVERPAGSALFDNTVEETQIEIKSTGSKTLDLTDDFETNPISIPIAESLTINCGAGTPPTATPTVPADDTATPTITNTPGGPTDTPAPPTATFTPAPPTATRTPTVPVEKLLGDVDSDGDVDSIDALWVLWVDAQLADEADLANVDSADVNGDGTINSIDALFILWIDADLL